MNKMSQEGIDAWNEKVDVLPINKESFERILPPCYNTAEEAIRNGNILLSHYAKEKRNDLNFF